MPDKAERVNFAAGVTLVVSPIVLSTERPGDMRRPGRTNRLRAVVCLAVWSLAATAAFAGSPSGDPPAGYEFAPTDERILGVIPNYQTVSDPSSHTAPLTVKQKFKLFVKETSDPFTGASALMGAAMSQYGNGTPKYGEGGGAYAQRFGAAVTDFATQNFFSDAVLASLFHQDPRYFRKGPSAGILSRVWYSMSRTVITRQDSGRPAFNVSGLLGMGLGIAASNLYYPRASISGEVVRDRFGTSLMGASLGNLLPEFWPDIKAKLFHRKSP